MSRFLRALAWVAVVVVGILLGVLLGRVFLPAQQPELSPTAPGASPTAPAVSPTTPATSPT